MAIWKPPWASRRTAPLVWTAVGEEDEDDDAGANVAVEEWVEDGPIEVDPVEIVVAEDVVDTRAEEELTVDAAADVPADDSW